MGNQVQVGPVSSRQVQSGPVRSCQVQSSPDKSNQFQSSLAKSCKIVQAIASDLLCSLVLKVPPVNGHKINSRDSFLALSFLVPI